MAEKTLLIQKLVNAMYSDTIDLDAENANCPCGNKQLLGTCCLPFIRGSVYPTTPEQLMRSRYTAYVLHEIDYIVETTHPSQRRYYPKKEIEAWANEVEWKGLEIVDAFEDQVKFIALFTSKKGKLEAHREWSFFKLEYNRWYFLEGKSF